MVSRAAGPILFDEIVNLCREAGFDINVAKETMAFPNIIGLVMVGVGLAFVPSSEATPAITPDPTLIGDQNDKLAELGKLNGVDFDKEYAAGQLTAHEDALALNPSITRSPPAKRADQCRARAERDCGKCGEAPRRDTAADAAG